MLNLKRPRIAKEILRKKNREGKHSSSDIRLLYSYSNQNSIILTQNCIYRSKQQNRKPRNKPKHVQSVNLQQTQEYAMRKESLFSKLFGKLDSLMQMNHIRKLLHTIHKNKLKMI